MGIKQSFIREIQRMSSRKLYLLSTLVLPILGMLFFASFFSQGVPRDLPIAICDQDNTQTSAKLIRMLDAGSYVKVAKRVERPEQAEDLIQRGEVYAYVQIPNDFQNQIFRGEAPQVASYINNVYLIAGGLITKDVSTILKTFGAGLNLTKRIKKGESEHSAHVAVNPIAIDAHILFNPYTNYFYYLATTFLPIILLMFVLLSSIYAVGIELKESTAKEWLDSANGSVWRALTGKLLPYFIIFIVLGVFMNSLLFKYFGVPQNGNPILVSYNTIVFVLAYMACGVFFITMFHSLRMALSVGSLYSAMAFTFSGLTFPFIAMDKGIVAFGQLFPFTHYLKVFVDQSMRGAGIEYSWQSLIALHVFLLLPLLVLPKLKTISTQSKYWGKS